jgi:hypothetical protein
MKIKLTVLCGILLASSAFADVAILINNGADDVPWQAKSASSGFAKSASLPPLNAPKIGSEGVYVTSLAASSSPDVARSRVNAMVGLGGGTVPTDRDTDAAAWYTVPMDPAHPDMGLQWFDLATTSFTSWLGRVDTQMSTQRGHRLVIHVCGTGPVPSYYGTVSTTLTNAGLNATYAIGTNTSNAEIPAGPNFVLINFGPDGTNNSTIDPTTGRYIAGGDDAVYDNGQLPSTITYNWWVRFGATVVVTAGSQADLVSLRGQFSRTNQTLTATLNRRMNETTTVVASKTVTSAQAKLHINRNGSMVRLHLVGGQEQMPYGLEQKDLITNSWSRIVGQSIYSGGSPVDLQNSSPERYYRAVAP